MNNFEERKKRENNYTLYIYVRAKSTKKENKKDVYKRQAPLPMISHPKASVEYLCPIIIHAKLLD